MAQPGQPSSRGEDWLVRRLQDLEREVRELKAANVFGLTGINPKDGGTEFDGYVKVNGRMDVSGDAEFTGNVKIGGTLDLPAGIIGNEALASPLTTGAAGFTASNQSFDTASTNYGTQNIAVPDGFTRALVMNGVSAGATNSGAAGDYIYVAADIEGTKGGEIPTFAAASFYASASAFAVRTIEGLTPGATIAVSARVRTGSGAWVPAGANIININALALFYR